MYKYAIIVLVFLSVSLWATPKSDLKQTGSELQKRANQYYKNKEYQKAIILYRKSMERGANAGVVSFNIGNAYFQKGDLPRAAAAYRRAVRESPKKSEASLFNLAAVLFRLEQYGESIAAYQRGLSIDENNTSAWLYLSEAFMQTGEKVGAQKSLEKALSLEPDDVTIVYQLAEIHVSMKEIDQAVDLVRMAYHVHPDETDFLFYIGDLYRLEDRHSLAISAYREGLSANPDNIEALYKMADVLAGNEQRFLAIEALQKALLINPDFTDAAIFLGNMAYDLKWWEKAFDVYYNLAEKKNGEGLQGLLNLSYEFQNKKDFKRAFEIVNSIDASWFDDSGQKSEWMQLVTDLE